MKLKIALPLILILCSFRAPTNEIIFEGSLRSKTSQRVAGLPVLIKKRGVIMASSTTGKSGNFTMSFNEGSGERAPISLLYVNKKGDTLLLGRFAMLTEQSAKFRFDIP